MTILRSGGIDIFYIDESVLYPNFFATVVRVPFLRNQQSQWRFVWENAYDQADQWRRLLSKRHNVKFRQELHAHEILGRKGLLHKQNRNLTVEENIKCILECLKLSKTERKLRLESLLHELHLEPLAKKKAVALSGGERRRLEITRALVTNPIFLMLDEPFANIDPISVHDLKKMIQHLSNKNISILITDHNAREIFSVVHRSYIVMDGRVLISGSVEELVNHNEVRRAYLGNEFKL